MRMTSSSRVSRARRRAPGAAFAAAKLLEEAAVWDGAAERYLIVADRYPTSEKAGDALFNAGRFCTSTSGAYAEASKLYARYARDHKAQKDAADVAYRIGAVQAKGGQTRAAVASYVAYAK